jgi:hypothetical protein
MNVLIPVVQEDHALVYVIQVLLILEIVVIVVLKPKLADRIVPGAPMVLVLMKENVHQALPNPVQNLARIKYVLAIVV